MLLFKHFTILADLAPSDGYTRNFGYCLKITNLEQYPNHLLFVQIGSERPDFPKSSYKLIKTGECVPLGGYRPVATIAAISKDKIQPDKLENSSPGTSLQNASLEKALIIGTSTIGPPRELPLIYEGRQIEDSFQIDSIAPNRLQLSLAHLPHPEVSHYGFLGNRESGVGNREFNSCL